MDINFTKQSKQCGINLYLQSLTLTNRTIEKAMLKLCFGYKKLMIEKYQASQQNHQPLLALFIHNELKKQFLYYLGCAVAKYKLLMTFFVGYIKKPLHG
jgi:hypothetical protein